MFQIKLTLPVGLATVEIDIVLWAFVDILSLAHPSLVGSALRERK